MNASPSPPAGSPHSWLAHARSDLRITQICRSDSGVLPNQTVFHAQQAAEKAIKAVLLDLEHKIRFPRTYDLGELIVLIRQHAVMWPFAPDEVEALSPFAVETRYISPALLGTALTRERGVGFVFGRIGDVA